MLGTDGEIKQSPRIFRFEGSLRGFRRRKKRRMRGGSGGILFEEPASEDPRGWKLTVQALHC